VEFPAYFLIDPFLLVLLVLFVAISLGGIALIVAALSIAAGVALFMLAPLAAALSPGEPPAPEKPKPRNPRLAFLRACLLIPAWIAFVVLAGVLAYRLIAA
jgi:hypothetical protein